MHPIISVDGIDPLRLSPLLNATILPEPLEMVRLTTKGGRQIVLTPESLFALKKVDGSPVIRPNRAVPALKPMLFTGPISDTFDASDPRYWYIAGLVVSTGILPTHPTHAAAIYFPKHREWELEQLHAFLTRYFETVEQPIRNALEMRAGRPPSLTINVVRDIATLSGKVINIIINRLADAEFPITSTWGNRIIARASEPDWSFLHNMTYHRTYSAFMAGLLAGALDVPEGRLIVHRNSGFLREINQLLFEDLAIPTELRINPHEPKVLWTTKAINFHALLIPRRHYLKVQDAGLSHWDRDYINGPGHDDPLGDYLDQAVSIEPAGTHEATIFEGEGEAALGDFVFELSFEPNEVALDIASMPELFTDVHNADEVIKNAPVHFIKRKKL